MDMERFNTVLGGLSEEDFHEETFKGHHVRYAMVEEDDLLGYMDGHPFYAEFPMQKGSAKVEFTEDDFVVDSDADEQYAVILDWVMNGIDA